MPFVVFFNDAQAGDKNAAEYSRKMYDASKGTEINDQRVVLKNEKGRRKKYSPGKSQKFSNRRRWNFVEMETLGQSVFRT